MFICTAAGHNDQDIKDSAIYCKAVAKTGARMAGRGAAAGAERTLNFLFFLNPFLLPFGITKAKNDCSEYEIP